MNFKNLFRLSWHITLAIAVILTSQVRSEYISSEPTEQVRAFTRWEEFDYVSWTVEALWQKQLQSVVKTQNQLTIIEQRYIVFNYLNIVSQLDKIKIEIENIFSDPAVSEPEVAALPLLTNQRDLETEYKKLGAVAESIIQSQIGAVIAMMGIGFVKQPVPPVLYHVTPLPMALIVSPRNVIRQDADISLQPDLSLDQIADLEKNIETDLNVSALVVPIGGVGVYPTMVKSSADLGWMIETAAHEWVHNYLTLHPLGVLYYSSPELRTINETTASIAGKEISAAVLSGFYPEFVVQLTTEDFFPLIGPKIPEEGGGYVFDFRAEMRETRVQTDTLLAQGKIDEAEHYMEQRRQIFWENGYRIRRINQAYFAFYGAYADTPGGAAGNDPVGAAVRTFRADSNTLGDFLERIAWVTSYETLKKLLEP